MKFNFQLKFDSLFEFSAPAYDDRQISYLLTEAQFRVFIKRYNPLGNKYQKGFEADEQRRRDLEQLIKPATVYGLKSTGTIEYYCTWETTNLITTCTIGAGGDLLDTTGLNDGQEITGVGIGPTGATTIAKIKNIISNTTFTLEETSSTASEEVLTKLTGGLGKSTVQGGVHPSGIFLDMPSNFLYAVEEAAKVAINGSKNAKESWIRPVKHDEYLANINNPYKKPYKDLVWRMDISRSQIAEGSSIASTAKRSELVLPQNTPIVDPTTSYSLSYYRVRYLSTPPSIVVDEFNEDNQRHCVLDETLHREIIDEAVVIAQAAAQKESYQIGQAEVNRAE